MIEVSSLEYFFLFTFSLAIVLILTPLMRKIALSIDFVDRPNSAHKTHKEAVPYLGGVAIVIGTLATFYFPLISRSQEREIILVSTVMGPAIILAIVGLIDDLCSLNPATRFVAQSIAGTAVAGLVVFSNSSGNPTGNTIVDLTLSVLWIVGVTNAINFFDNIDGGSSGIVAISSFFIFLISSLNGQFLVAAGSLVLTGTTLGFLYWNRAPARIYMGDTGALFLGFLLSILTIRLDPEITSFKLALLVPPLLLAVPILDTSVAVISRLRRRISPVKGGKDHLSHRLMRLGFSKQRTVYSLWSLQLVFAATAICLSFQVKYSEIALILMGVFWVALFAVFLGIPDEG